QVLLASDGHNGIHIERQSVEMRGNDCNGPWSYRSPDQSRVDVKRTRVDVDEDRFEAAHSSDFRYDPEGQRWKNDLRAGWKIEGLQNVIEGHPPVRRADGVRHSAIFRKAFFKHGDFGPLHATSAAKRFKCCVC